MTEQEAMTRAEERGVLARFISPNAFNPSVMNPEERPDLVANAQAYAFERADKILAYLDFVAKSERQGP